MLVEVQSSERKRPYTLAFWRSAPLWHLKYCFSFLLLRILQIQAPWVFDHSFILLSPCEWQKGKGLYSLRWDLREINLHLHFSFLYLLLLLLLLLLILELCLHQESRGSYKSLAKRSGDTKSSFDSDVSHLVPLSKSLHLSGPHTCKMVRTCVYDSLYIWPCMLHDP